LLSGSSAGEKKAGKEVLTEPISSTGANPFSPPTGTDYSNMPAVQTSGISTQPGGQVGLHGGTERQGSCDKTQLVTYLQQNPDKGAAWASTVGIQQSQISTYVDGLTSVLLRSDTRVTNHGYKNGRATTIQSVLQAGTAVLVDDKGEPVTKCYCGNPLTPPVACPKVYYGPKWSGYNPNNLTVIIQNTVIIDTFTLYDPKTGKTFTRPRGSDGTQDTPTDTTPSTTTPSTTPSTTPRTTPSTTPSPTQAGPTPEERAKAKLQNAASTCYPFPAPIEQATSQTLSIESGNGPDNFVLLVVDQTASGEQDFRWRVDRATGAFTPLDSLAQAASNHCSGLN
jgi:hypothetical protein